MWYPADYQLSKNLKSQQVVHIGFRQTRLVEHPASPQHNKWHSRDNDISYQMALILYATGVAGAFILLLVRRMTLLRSFYCQIYNILEKVFEKNYETIMWLQHEIFFCKDI